MIELGFSARDAQPHWSSRGEEGRPRQFLGATLHLVKRAGVKLSKPHDDSARCSEPEIRLVQPIEIAGESNSSDFLAPTRSQTFELARRYGFKSGSRGCE